MSCSPPAPRGGGRGGQDEGGGKRHSGSEKRLARAASAKRPAQNRAEARGSPVLLQCERLRLRTQAMDDARFHHWSGSPRRWSAWRRRGARAADFGAARLFRHDPSERRLRAGPGLRPRPRPAGRRRAPEAALHREPGSLRRRPAGQPRAALGRARHRQELARQGGVHGGRHAPRRPEAGGDRPRRRRPPAGAVRRAARARPSASWCSATTSRSRRARRRPRR